jgi:hypothetical protein
MNNIHLVQSSVRTLVCAAPVRLDSQQAGAAEYALIKAVESPMYQDGAVIQVAVPKCRGTARCADPSRA